MAREAQRGAGRWGEVKGPLNPPSLSSGSTKSWIICRETAPHGTASCPLSLRG